MAPLPTGTILRPPFDAALEALIRVAKADLAQRLSLAVDQVGLVEARAVQWPDPGLGCPRPGMRYKQVPVDGLLIRLKVAGRVYNYHSGGSRAPFLCEQPEQNRPRLPPGKNEQR